MPQLIIVLVALLLGVARVASAGECDDHGATAMVQEIETYAHRGRGAEPLFAQICMETAGQRPKLVKRTLTACAEILQRHPKAASCVEWSARFGAKRLGSIELFDKAGELFGLSPWSGGRAALQIYEALADARANALIVAAWTSASSDQRAGLAKHRYAWTTWRRDAIDVLAKLGGAAEREFLRAQAPALKDRGLKKALARALTTLDKRLDAE